MCGKHDFTPIRKFNLMFKTAIGVTEDSSSTCYLRPETAQGIFGFMVKPDTMRSLIVTKVVVAPMLCERELRLDRRKGNRLKREKAVQSSQIFL